MATVVEKREVEYTLTLNEVEAESLVAVLGCISSFSYYNTDNIRRALRQFPALQKPQGMVLVNNTTSKKVHIHRAD